MITLLASARFFKAVARSIGQAAAWLVVLLVLTVVIDVVSRRFIVLGSTKLQDLEWHFHAALFLLSLGYAYVEGEHVRIDVLQARFGPKLAAVIEIVGAALFLVPFCVIVLHYGYNFVERSFLLDEGSASQTGLPHRWIIKSMLLAGFATLLAAAIGAIADSIAVLLGGKHPDDPHVRHQETGL
ncbi:TRAP-type mannitol/chloroaromatic compound transport system permease small subunit [Hoeflea marina]|uniref:TRAP transporter small permease protein n=1 Tax=Hoeflea marina TaxID=274592 RepID=A0A317PKK0_9HYPH|nr:TRAP transporter small permease subunit [Hoeflea marina]PWW01472.1 TRAP-type mannitol/chloroaromatic compound transport system permease small subunit [Hoeflea marina]